MLRVAVSGDRIGTDLAFAGEVKMQGYTNGRNDGDDATQIVKIRQDIPCEGDDREHILVTVDTMTDNKVTVDFEQADHGKGAGNTVYLYNYVGSVKLSMAFIPEGRMPAYEPWDKYDDLTTFTDPEANTSEAFAGID